jgi:hypothetical protein
MKLLIRVLFVFNVVFMCDLIVVQGERVMMAFEGKPATSHVSHGMKAINTIMDTVLVVKK